MAPPNSADDAAPPAAGAGAALASMPFERALGELETIVKRLESGSVALEDSLTLWERGEALKRHCEGVLASAEARVQRIAAGDAGGPTLAPFDP